MYTISLSKSCIIEFTDELTHLNCVKSVQIQSFFWSVFPCIRTEYRKIRTRKSSVFGHFSRSVNVTIFSQCSHFILQKTKDFLVFSRGTKWKHWSKIDWQNYFGSIESECLVNFWSEFSHISNKYENSFTKVSRLLLRNLYFQLKYGKIHNKKSRYLDPFYAMTFFSYFYVCFFHSIQIL